MKKIEKILAVIGVVAALGAGVLGTHAVFAADDPSTSSNGVSELVRAIATKFNLDASAVQAVFDEQRETRYTQMEMRGEKRFQSKLSQAVTDGILTQDQADLVNAKHVEMKEFRMSLQGKTPEEIRIALKEQKEALDAWAKENNIPKSFVFFGRGSMMMGRGHGAKMMSGTGSAFHAEMMPAMEM